MSETATEATAPAPEGSPIPSADGPDPWRPQEPEAAGDEGDEVGLHEQWTQAEQKLIEDLGGREHFAAYQTMADSFPEEAQALRDEWRGDFGGNMEMARSFYDSVRTEGLDELLETAIDDDGRRLGNHPTMLRLAAVIGRRLATTGGDPATIPDMRDATARGPQGRQAPSQIEVEIRRIRDLQHGDWRARREWEDPATQERLGRLYEQRGRA